MKIAVPVMDISCHLKHINNDFDLEMFFIIIEIIMRTSELS